MAKLSRDTEAAIWIVADDDLLGRQPLGKVSWIENERDLVVAQLQGLRQRVDFLATHGAVKVLMIGQCSIHILWFSWRL